MVLPEGTVADARRRCNTACATRQLRSTRRLRTQIIETAFDRGGRQIFGSDRLERCWLNPEDVRKSAAADAVFLHRCEIVAAHQGTRQPLEHPRLQLRQARPERHDGSLVPGHLPAVANEIAQRIDTW